MYDCMTEHEVLEDVHLVPFFDFGSTMLLWDNTSLNELLLNRCGVPKETLAVLLPGKGNVIKAVFAGSVKRFTHSGKYRTRKRRIS